MQTTLPAGIQIVGWIRQPELEQVDKKIENLTLMANIQLQLLDT